MLISIVSGLLLSYLYIYYQRFPDADNLTIVVICCVAFYVFSIILRIQNHRGKAITGKPGFNEKALKYFSGTRFCNRYSTFIIIDFLNNAE